MKKISLLKSLALFGAVGLTSVCVVETALLMQKHSNDAKIDISTLSGQILDRPQSGDVVPSDTELLNLLKIAGVRPLSGGTPYKLTNINDIRVITGSIQNNSFQITSVPNSATYEADKLATIYINVGEKTELSSIITSVPDLYLNKYESEVVTKAQILKNLENRYVGLNINHLQITNLVHHGDNEINTADVVAKTGSQLYTGLASVAYYTSGAAVVTYSKTTLAPGDTNIMPTFTFAGETQQATYTCANVTTPVTFNNGNGAFGYNAGVNFNGGLYQVKASYTSEGINFIAYTNVFAQPNIIIGNLTISKPSINVSNRNSGGYTYTENGISVTSGITFTCYGNAQVTSTKDADGMTFNATTGILNWDGVTPTYGGTYTITATHSGVITKASVEVADYKAEPIFSGADADDLTTYAGYLALITRATKVGSGGIANFYVSLSTTRWAPIYNALFLSAATNVYAECMLAGNVYQIDIRERGTTGNAWHYTLIANGTQSLTWTAVNIPTTISAAAGYITSTTTHYIKIPAYAAWTDSFTIELNCSLENSKQIIKLDVTSNTYFPIYGSHQVRFKRFGWVNNQSFFYLEMNLSYLYNTVILLTSNTTNFWKPTPITISTTAPTGYTWYNIQQ